VHILAIVERILAFVSEIINDAFDYLFGKKLLSARSVVASVTLSLASAAVLALSTNRKFLVSVGSLSLLVGLNIVHLGIQELLKLLS
jgi:hypothetical protein